MAEEEVLMEVIVNECDEVQFYSPADQCKTLYEDKDAMLRTIKEAVKEGVLVLPTVKWDEIKSVRFISNVEKSVEITTQEVLPETEYQTYEIVEEAPVDETVTSSEVPEEIIVDVGLSSGKELNSHAEHEMLESVHFIDERLNLCPYCDYRTYNVGHFKVHMRQHTGEAPFACEYCPYRSKQKSNLKRHLRQHLEGKDNFECEMCSFTCTKEKVYKRHLKLHQRSRPLRPCPFCDYFSSSLAHLTVHIRQHTGETPYHCGVCQYKTVQKSNLTRHLKKHRHHRVSKADKLRVCAHCNYRTPNSAHLLAHIRAAHTGEAPYSCKHCDYKSAQRSNLKRHMRKHTGERPFSCHLCSYSTAYAYVLKKHIENHPEHDEKFSCDSCDYFTNSSVEFKRHIKTHSGRSMYCCHFCGYISLNSDHFKVHLRRHTQEAPYQCHHCDYRSAQRSNLKRHIQTHTEENRWDKDVENSNETQCAIQSDISVMDVESNEVADNSQTLGENDIPENVEIIDTTNHENEDVEIYEAEEGYVEAAYSPDGDIEEAANVLPESNMEVVGEEHVITTPTEGEYDVYKDCGKIYLCSYCSYQSSSAEDIEAHIQEHDGSLVNGVEASENEISESDGVKTNNISFLNKSQTEKLKEFKRLLQEGTGGGAPNVFHVSRSPQQQIEAVRDKYYQQSVEPAEYRNQPSPEEVTLYGEIEESNEQEETIDATLKDSSIIIVGTPEELKQTTNECELCGFHARTIWELKSHIRVHTGEMSFVCPQCPFKTNQKYSFQRHVRHLHGWRGNRPPYQCKLCDFRTKNKENLIKHVQNHSKKMPAINCNICEQVMGSIAELKSHMKIHIGEAPYECFYCGKLIARKLHMRRHMKKHICTMEGKGPPYICDSCGYQTVFEANYLRHLETHELDPPKALICHYCRFVTLDNKVFRKHLADHKNPGSGELDSFLISEEVEESDSVNNNDADDTSKHKRKPLREHNTSNDESLEKSEKNYTLLQQGKMKNVETLSSIKSKYRSKRTYSTIVKKREYIRRAGNISESELRIRRRLDFGIKKVPKDPKEGFTVEICGEILKSKRQLRDFSDYGKLIKQSDLDLSIVLEKESHIENMFVPLRESIHALRDLKNSHDNFVTFTIYFKTKDEPDPVEISDNLTDIEAELLSDSNDTDIDSLVKSDDELLNSIDLLDGDKNGSLDDGRKTSRKELNHNENGISLVKQASNRKQLPLNSSIDTIKFFQKKIKERNEKMKQMRRLKVLRNSVNWNKNGTKPESFSSKNCVQVEYSYSDNIEMEEVVVDHNIDALPSLVS